MITRKTTCLSSSDIVKRLGKCLETLLFVQGALRTQGHPRPSPDRTQNFQVYVAGLYEFFRCTRDNTNHCLTSLRLRESPTYRYALEAELGIRGDYSESAL